MNPGSLPPLSASAEALLSTERDIVPQPEHRRRRALLRARTALWHARSLPDAGPRPFRFWTSLRLAAVAALFATSSLAAWLTLRPDHSRDEPPVASQSRPPKPVAVPAPRSTGSPEKTAPPAESSPPAESVESKPEAKTTPHTLTPRARPAAGSKGGSSPRELVLLNEARRAVAAREFEAALRLIERHKSSFPNSELREEREALRVRALNGVGLSKKASQAAREFESSFPNSVLAPQMNGASKTNP